MIAASDNVWSSADVVAVAPPLDLALVWVPREAGHADFVQPLADVRDGESIYVIGHPEGFRYTLSTGIVSGVRGRSVQISAAVSPGNSGGPVYDDRGNLLAIVSSKFDRNNDPNGENLGFAVAATALRESSAWTFDGKGASLLAAYIQAEKSVATKITTH
jgi:S1-C subfamily serine protease